MRWEGREKHGAHYLTAHHCYLASLGELEVDAPRPTGNSVVVNRNQTDPPRVVRLLEWDDGWQLSSDRFLQVITIYGSEQPVNSPRLPRTTSRRGCSDNGDSDSLIVPSLHSRQLTKRAWLRVWDLESCRDERPTVRAAEEHWLRS